MYYCEISQLLSIFKVMCFQVNNIIILDTKMEYTDYKWDSLVSISLNASVRLTYFDRETLLQL